MNTQPKTPDLLSREYWNSTIKMSLSKFFILCVLQEQPLHGYEIATKVELKTNSCCSPREGTIYPILKQFVNGGYVTFKTEVVSGRERKVYTITQKGREAFKVGLNEWIGITKCLQGCQSMVDKDCC